MRQRRCTLYILNISGEFKYHKNCFLVREGPRSSSSSLTRKTLNLELGTSGVRSLTVSSWTLHVTFLLSFLTFCLSEVKAASCTGWVILCVDWVLRISISTDLRTAVPAIHTDFYQRRQTEQFPVCYVCQVPGDKTGTVTQLSQPATRHRYRHWPNCSG